MKLSVNGRDHDIAADPATPLLWVLHDELGLTGTKCAPSVPPLANALYRATGKRFRSIPLAPQIA